METKLIHSEPTPGQRITELHAWIATYADGTEGIIAGGLQGIGMTPLVSSRRHVAEQLEAGARNAMRLSRDTAHRVVSVRLVSFTSTEGYCPTCKILFAPSPFCPKCGQGGIHQP